MYGGTSSGEDLMVRGRMEERKKISKEGDQSHASQIRTMTDVITVREKSIRIEIARSSER